MHRRLLRVLKMKGKTILMPIITTLMLVLLTGLATAQTTLYDGLIQYFPFDEINGTKLTSNLGMVGYVTNESIFTSEITGIRGTGADLTEPYTRMGFGTLDHSWNEPFTISIWVKKTENVTSYSPIMGSRSGNSGGGFEIIFNNGNLIFNRGSGLGSTHFYTETDWWSKYNDSWVHLIFTFDENNYTSVYLNSELKISEEFPLFPSALERLTIGAVNPIHVVSLQKYFYVDELGLWNRSLNSTEIQNLYGGGNYSDYPFTDVVYGCNHVKAFNFDPDANTDDGSCRYYLLYNFLSYYTFDEINGTTVFDSHGDAHGTVNNETVLSTQAQGIRNTAANLTLISEENANFISFTTPPWNNFRHDEMSFFAWVKLSEIREDRHTILITTSRDMFFYNGIEKRFELYIKDTDVSSRMYALDIDIEEDKWYFVGFTKGEGIRTGVNYFIGDEDGNYVYQVVTSTRIIPSAPFSYNGFGFYRMVSGVRTRPLHGFIDEVSFFREELSYQQIQLLYVEGEYEEYPFHNFSLGCVDSEALNYDPNATEDDGSCLYFPGCMDVFADNYDPIADHEDGSCYYLEIDTCEKLQAMQNNLTENYTLINDVDCSSSVGWDAGQGFLPIGNNTEIFTGNFDGQGYSISNIHISREFGVHGFISFIGENSTIQNINFNQFYICTHHQIPYINYRTGYVSLDNYGTIKNVNISVNMKIAGGCIWNGLHAQLVGGIISSRNYGNITGVVVTGDYHNNNNPTGVIAGQNDGIIKNAYTDIDIGITSLGARNHGGIAGTNNGIIRNSSAHGRFIYFSTSLSASGGGIAVTNNGLIENSYSTGIDLGRGTRGGIVATNTGTGIINNTWSNRSISSSATTGNRGGLVGNNQGIISNSYSFGFVGNATETWGGLIGVNTGTVINSYWDVEASTRNISSGGEPRNTYDLSKQNNFVDWNFNNVWGIIEENSYPYLLSFDVINYIPTSIDIENLPLNIMNYGDWQGAQFLSRSNLHFDSWWINDTTTFNINQSGFLDTNTVLNVGIYLVEVWVNDTLGNEDFITYELNITHRPITIASDNKTKLYGEPDPAFTYTILNGSLAYTDIVTGNLERDLGEQPGFYNITQGSLSINNDYNINFIEGNLEIIDNTPPVFTFIPENETITLSQEWLGAQFNATDNVGISAWWIEELNTTGNFTINQTGFLNWTEPLVIGEYYVEVFVNDTSSNEVSTIYKLRIVSPVTEEPRLPTGMPTDSTIAGIRADPAPREEFVEEPREEEIIEPEPTIPGIPLTTNQIIALGLIALGAYYAIFTNGIKTSQLPRI